MPSTATVALSILLGGGVVATTLLGAGVGQTVQAQGSKPNIIFVILDDVGIDQLAVFGNGGADPPHTPNMETVARNGVIFTNVWATPECSPSRATLFTGRFALRTGVEDIIVENHLPQSYMSQFEATLPRVLAKAGYVSGMVGKYHLGNSQDPAGGCAPSTRGFTFYEGLLGADPTSIDATAGGTDPSGSQVCGYYQTSAAGACYTAPGDSVRCTPIDLSNSAPGTDPARTCLQGGGIFVPNAACRVNEPKYSAFSLYNAFYVSPRTSSPGVLDPLYVNPGNSCPTTVDRRYLTTAQGIDGGNWWKQQSGPRMLTFSFSSMHTPYQKAPTDLVPDPQNIPATCSSTAPQRSTLNSMLEGVDVQIGRSLASFGLGTLGPDGRTLVSLNLANTLLVIMGDNGTQGVATRAPFDPTRAKSTVYQTGVWVPLIIAGSMVQSPNRSVDSMISSVDLFQLFGDIAGVDVKSMIPPSHTLDSQPMLAYLTNPSATGIRETNFTQSGVAIFSPDPSQRSWPCQIGNFCDDTLFGPGKQALCEIDNGGTWYGPGGAQQITSCCRVQALPNMPPLTFAPVHQRAMRGGSFNGFKGAYKLVELDVSDCTKPIANSSQAKPFPWAEYLTSTKQEFYNLTPTPDNPKGIDYASSDLASNCPQYANDLSTCLPNQVDVDNYNLLKNRLDAFMKSATSQNLCRTQGDGNLDMRVNQTDIANWQIFNGKGPSQYDINLDARTDEADLAIIQANLGRDCLDICTRSDLNRDGKVNAADMTLLNQQYGVCTDQIFCGSDLNGDGVVDNLDVTRMISAQQACVGNTLKKWVVRRLLTR